MPPLGQGGALGGEAVQHSRGDDALPAVHSGGVDAGGGGEYRGGHLVQGAVQLRQLGLLVRDELGQMTGGVGIAVGVVPLEHHGAQVQGGVLQAGQVALGRQGAQGDNGADHLGDQPGGVGALSAGAVGVFQLFDFCLQGANGLPGGEGGGVAVQQGHRVALGGLGAFAHDLVHVAAGAVEGNFLADQDAQGLAAYVQGVGIGIGGDHVLLPALGQIDGDVDGCAQAHDGDHNFGCNSALFHRGFLSFSASPQRGASGGCPLSRARA